MKKWKWALAGAAGGLSAAAAIHRRLLYAEQEQLTPPGTMVEVNGHSMHVYAEGPKEKVRGRKEQGQEEQGQEEQTRKERRQEEPDGNGGRVHEEAATLVFLSGGGTAAPVYDFRPLYRKLSPWYRCVVVEKAGYGYSEIAKRSRQLDVMLEETRLALRLAGEKGPFVLLPHSMSGLEAIYWAQRYPDEVMGIVGMDMAFPKAYENKKANPGSLKLMGVLGFLGIQRCPLLQMVGKEGLTEEEYRQAKLLGNRNFLNKVVLEEATSVYANAEMVKKHRKPEVPFLLFCSDGKELGGFWVPLQKKYAEKMNCELIRYSCGHYLHHYKAEEMADTIRPFVEKIRKQGLA